MEEFSAKIQSKISKMESSLMDLTNEIVTAIKFLIQLRENSTQIVKNLNSIEAPEMYLKEFMYAHCFILKYQNFLTEVNCKFEMLEMSDKSVNNLKYVKKPLSEIESKNVKKPLSETESKNVKKPLSETESKNVSKADPLNATQNENLTRETSEVKVKAKKPSHTKNKLKSSPKNKSDTVGVNSHNGNANIVNEKPKDNASVDSNQTVIFREKKFLNDNKNHLQALLQSNNLTESVSDSDLMSLTSSSSRSVKKTPVQLFVKDNLEKNNSSKVQDLEVKCSTGAQDSRNSEASPMTEPKKNKGENSEIKPVSIARNLGEEYDVLIENIISPSEFYVFIKNNQSNLFDKLENELKLLPKMKNKSGIKKSELKKACLSGECGNYGLFYSKCDETWYRVEITNWCLTFGDDFVTVFLLDYGESKCVSIDDLKPMPECFKKYPAFAQRCHLHGVFPLDYDQNGKTLFWEKGSTEKMKSLTEKSDKLRIKIAPDDRYHSEVSLPVTLWLVDQGNKCVNQLLVESKYAVQEGANSQIIINGKKKEENENLNSWNPMKEDFESYRNCYDFDFNDPAAVIYGYVGNDYKRICKHYEKNGFCYKGNSCKKEHKRLDPLGFTTDQEEVYYNAFNPFPVQPPKTLINVQITCLLKFNQFCCIQTDGFYSGEENLQSLLKFMNDAENVREMKKLLIPPSAGQIVIAKYSEDCSWYRAKILESNPEKDLYTVLFVDYGNKENLPLSSIRAIEARYLHLPFQGMKCYIFGVDRNPTVPIKKIMEYVNERIYSGNITIEIVSKLPGEGTNLLVHVFDENGRNIGNDLIAEGYGVSKEEILIHDNSDLIPG